MTSPGQSRAVAKAIFARAAEIERTSSLQPLHEDHERVNAAAEPSDPNDPHAGPRFVRALIDLAANCFVRLADVRPDDLRELPPAPDNAITVHWINDDYVEIHLNGELILEANRDDHGTDAMRVAIFMARKLGAALGATVRTEGTPGLDDLETSMDHTVDPGELPPLPPGDEYSRRLSALVAKVNGFVYHGARAEAVVRTVQALADDPDLAEELLGHSRRSKVEDLIGPNATTIPDDVLEIYVPGEDDTWRRAVGEERFCREDDGTVNRSFEYDWVTAAGGGWSSTDGLLVYAPLRVTKVAPR